MFTVNTPLPQFPENSFAELAPQADGSLAPRPDPDDPPWGLPVAVVVWVVSFLLLAFVPAFALLGYIAYTGQPLNDETLNHVLKNDPNGILTSVAAVIPTHLLTIALAWAVVTGLGRRPFRQTLGWSFGGGFGLWTSAALAGALLFFGTVVLRFVGGDATDIDQIINSSTAARFTMAFLAVATAPLVEELIYRGVLYPAMQRAMGALWAVVGVSTLFALVHYYQYRNNLGVLGVITLLSFALTIVRAKTGRLLPCFVIHTVFNGFQSLYLVLQHFRPELFEAEASRQGLLLCAGALARSLGLHV
ncbi:MAG TPA: CPBP family intramembrane glutamic endopeptidase [Pyrinomonadaceae bacterium]|nr:CPBP family intramembrane glutamic endopeptidase [Pyrinomonadaceae bacterium]